MNNDWKNYLLQNGAEQSQDGLFIFDSTFSDAGLAEGSDIICDLSHFSTVVVAGGDATDVIQGQFTNDVNKVDEEHSQISAFCNNKGRMLANFRLFQSQQNYFLSIRNDLVDGSIEHLQKYVLRAQVAIQDVSEQLIHIGISGNNAEKLLSQSIDKLNTTVDSVSQNDDYIAIRVADKIPRYEIFCSLQHAKALWESLSEKTSVTSSTYWDYLNIMNGLPFIDSNTREEFVPQMANMELINGVSFEKGCYTGQEIVARTHYLGKQKRRTYRIKIISDTPPKAGDQLATGTSTENQYTGTLITVYQTAANEYEALAVIQIKSAESETLKLKDADADADAEITLLELPYPLEEQE
ncbi:MAG: folate-binding protein [Gammaproteobacteria bacterium]|nr:folate-binding protein [Gammaproteobacteria bacterium]NNJ48862.1 folate-binding protein YgfZ [Gammaproteobacteria bacterium]